MSRFPVSVKGVQRAQGGAAQERARGVGTAGQQAGDGESPEDRVRREAIEEDGLDVEVGPLLDAWIYEVLSGAPVLVLSYGCFAESVDGRVRSEEHSDMHLFDPEELDRISLPDGTKRSAIAWSRHLALLDESDL